MNNFVFIAVIAFLLSVTSIVVPTGASLTCQQALDNCSNEYAKGGIDCGTAKMFEDCVNGAFSSCSSDQNDQSMFYGTLSASHNNVEYTCVNPAQQAQIYSSGSLETRPFSFAVGVVVSLAPLVLALFFRN